MIYALDIETAPDTPYLNYKDAALDFNRSHITVVGVAEPDSSYVTRDISTLISRPYLAHNGKFDFKFLLAKKSPLTISDYAEDTYLMALALREKVAESYLVQYEEQRKAINKVHKAEVHRAAKQHSLKVLAPYFLGVDPFWETASHDNDEYVLKDVLYTQQLYPVLKRKLEAEGTYDFYKKYLLPWSRMITLMELRGVKINMDLLYKKKAENDLLIKQLEHELSIEWADVYRTYEEIKKAGIIAEAREKTSIAVSKLKPVTLKDEALAAERTEEKRRKTAARYEEALKEKLQAVEPLNLNSPTQLKWVFKDYFKLDINVGDDEESTGKAVLQRLAAERRDIKLFMDLRAAKKLASSFFEPYIEMQWQGRLYGSFNIGGARTGRLSSSNPNLQQVPGHLHELFIASDADRCIINYDLANIEPLLIAFLTEDKTLCELMIQQKSFHDLNTREVFGIENVDKVKHKKERDACKEFGLSFLYGAYIYRIQESLAKRGFNKSVEECKRLFFHLQNLYEDVFAFKADLDAKLEVDEPVNNLFGRPVIVKDNVKMQGFNTFIQGSASDLLVESVRRAYREMLERRIDCHPILLVHDECVWDCAKKDAEEANKTIYKHLTAWELSTRWGTFHTQCEGGISDYWKK